MAAHRFTNLATMHLGVPVHFMKVIRAGIIYKAYAHDGVELPSDGSGSVEGQRVCRFGTTRPVFASQPDWSRRPRLSRPVGPAPNSANACAHRDNYFGEIEMAAADLLTATGYEDGPITRHVVGRMAAHLGFDCCTRRTCRNAPVR
jgi:predicted transcriptional regulator